jgi:putative salt-induced outer membrane protein YdiY
MIELDNGDILNVIIVDETYDSITVKHPVLDEITIKKSKIKEIATEENESVKKAKTDLAKALAAEPSPPDEGVFGTGFLTDWNRSVDLGLSGASGPSNNAKLTMGANADFEDKEKRWRFNAIYFFNSEDSTTSDNRFSTTLLRDWFINDSSWFYFATGGYDWDQFKDWDHRLRLGGGSGYQFYKSDTAEFATRHGLNNTYSIFPGQNNKYELELLLGLDWSWKINDHMSLNLVNTTYPALTDLGQFRNVTDFEWKLALAFQKSLALKLGLHNEYDTTETEKNDLKYYAALAWLF